MVNFAKITVRPKILKYKALVLDCVCLNVFNSTTSSFQQQQHMMASRVANKRKLSDTDETATADSLLQAADDSSVNNSGQETKKLCVEASPSTSKRRDKNYIHSIPLEKPEIYVENGLRIVKPYWFKYMTAVKGRWEGRQLIDILKQEFYGKNPDFFETAIRLNRLLLNDGPAPLDHKLTPNDVLTNVAHRHEIQVLDKPFKIVVDNDDVLVVDKPCSLPVHPCGRYYFNSLTQMLENEFGYKGLKLLYRLDRLTSGLVILSKSYKVDQKLKKEIINRSVQKEYVCLVEGEFPNVPIECTKAMGPCEPKLGIQCIVPENESASVSENGPSVKGKACVTGFELLKTNGKVSIVRCSPKTGRTHQIRVHLQYLGYPIINDYMYNNKVWGPEKGKSGNYGKTLEQLCKDLMKEFGAENWVIDFENSYDDFKEHKEKLVDAQGIVDVAALLALKSSNDGKVASSTLYDPFCIDCHVTARVPTENSLQMFLHCWKYKGSDWEYETELPYWAKELPSEKADLST